VGAGTIEIVYYAETVLADGSTEKRVVSRQVWDRARWYAEMSKFAEARLALERKPYIATASGHFH
jgi:hypothetical protein